MDGIISVVSKINSQLSELIWGTPTVILILFVGLVFTFGCKGVQFFGLARVWRETVGTLFKRKNAQTSKKGISAFQAMSTSLATTIGTGSITGVATAIYLGGAGAVFWMWVSATFGMATAYAEGILSVKFRRESGTRRYGGAMYYIADGLKSRWLASLMAIFCVLGSLGMGNMAQGNAIADALQASFQVPKCLTAFAIFVIIIVIMTGGIKRVGKITEVLVPFATIFYVVGCMVIIVKNSSELRGVFTEILCGAFGVRAVAGGFSGAVVKRAVSYGFRRGVFSNEAGLGTTASVHASSDIDEPRTAGYWGIFEVFVDTIVICTLTAVVLLSSGEVGGTQAVITAFEGGLGRLGGVFVTASVVLFAFATLVGWSCIGQSSAEYLAGKRGAFWYRKLYAVTALVGCLSSLELVWEISDTFNGLMAVPNLVALILLAPIVFEEHCKKK